MASKIYRVMRKTLQLWITLLSLIALLFYMYIQWSLIVVGRDGTGLQRQFNVRKVLGTNNAPNISVQICIPDDDLKMSNGESESYVIRKTLTKSVYPITLTAPYIIENPDVCSGVNVTLLFTVHTAPGHILRRKGIRDTFGNTNIFRTIETRIVFLLGIPSDKKLAKMIQEENSKYGDIVQGNFLDSYRNLTLKGVMSFRWITQHCSHAKLIAKIDDDFFIDIFKVVQYYVPKYANQTKQLVCNPMYGSTVLRKLGNKWQVDADYFRGVKHYPKYCSGFTVFMTPDAVNAMYHAAFFTPIFWVDDVYLFGLLPSKQKISPIKLGNFSLKLKECEKAYSSPEPTRFVSCGVKNETVRKLMWEQTLSKLPELMRKKVKDKVLATRNRTIVANNRTKQNSE